MKPILTLIVFCLGLATGQAEERLWLKSKINGKAVRLAFDSGASRSILFRDAAIRLGLKVTDPPAGAHPSPGQVLMGHSGVCTLTLGKNTVKTWFAVVAVPTYLGNDADGVLGWDDLCENILRIDATAHRLQALKAVPKAANAWLKLRVRPKTPVLALEVSSSGDEQRVLLVDTGSPYGVGLPPKQWQQLKAAQPKPATTLIAYYTLGSGAVVSEEMWAERLPLGPLELRGVPVMAADPTEVSAGFTATLGMAALKRLDFVVDGRQGVAYLRTKQTPPRTYPHNRIGAVFVRRSAQDDALVAHVLESSPAAEAGIRAGDVLLKIGKWNATQRTAEATPRQYWTLPAGTRLDLTLRRGADTFKTTVVLREMLTPK